MKRCLYLFSILLFWACSKENSLTVNANSFSKSLFPSFNDSIQFSSSLGDTISLYVLGNSNYYNKTNQEIELGGSLGSLDFIEEERRILEIGNTEEDLYFVFTILAQYQSSNPQYSDDVFHVRYKDPNDNLQALIIGRSEDSLVCSFQFEECFRLDSLSISDKSYSSVYYNMPTNSSPRTAFISPNNGLLKFVDRDSVVFELIP